MIWGGFGFVNGTSLIGPIIPQEMDLSFPEIEKYKKPGQEHARYLENNVSHCVCDGVFFFD